jgi:hypothetical protein
MTMGASKKIIVVEGNGEGGASQKVAVDNAVFVGGDLEAGYIPVVQEDLSVEWQSGGEGTGDVTGFGTSTAGHITVYKDATGKVIEDGGTLASVFATTLHAADSKTTPVDADELGLVDSAASYVLKKLTWANLKATLLAYFLPFFSRPNILINTNGLDPINQAGATTVANGAYGFDMWKVAHTCTTVTISATATGMRHTVTTKGAGTPYMYPYQLIENYASYIGKEITAVAKVKSNLPVVLGLSNTVAYFAESTAHAGDGGTQILSVTGTLGAGATGLAVVLRSGNVAADGDYIEWEWIKLEEGSVATPYAIPDKAIDNIRADRYQQAGSVQSVNGVLWVPFRGRMRAAPAVSVSAGSASNITADGFTLTHNAAAAITFLADENL